MIKHDEHNIEWVGFPKNRFRRIKGVYMIGDIYIGASVHIRRRIIQHLNDCKRGRHSNNDVLCYFNSCNQNKTPIQVRFLSNNPFDEDDLTNLFNVKTSNQSRFYHQIYNKH